MNARGRRQIAPFVFGRYANGSPLRQRSTPIALRARPTVVWRMGPRAKDAAKEIERLFRELLPEVAIRKSGNQSSRL